MNRFGLSEMPLPLAATGMLLAAAGYALIRYRHAIGGFTGYRVRGMQVDQATPGCLLVPFGAVLLAAGAILLIAAAASLLK